MVVEITSGSSAAQLGSANIGTEKSIVALTPSKGLLAWANDLNQLLIGDGTNWWILSAYLDKDIQAPDMGWVQGSNREGYGSSYLTDKTISNSNIGSNANSSEGGLRYNATAKTLQAYLNGTWQTVVSNFVLKENSADNYALEHAPVGFTQYIQIYSGNSDLVGLNGIPIIQGYNVSMGAYPVAPIVNGGTF